MKLFTLIMTLFLMSSNAFALANQMKVISFSPLQLAVKKSELNKLINDELQALGSFPIDQSGFKGAASEFKSDFEGADRLKVNGKIRGDYKTPFGKIGINGSFEVKGILSVRDWKYQIDVTDVDIEVSNSVVNFLIGTLEAFADDAIKDAVEEALNKDGGSFIDFNEAHPIAQRIRDASTLDARFDSTNLILTLNQR